MTNTCKAFLKAFRATVGAKPDEKIDKRYKSFSGFLAPNDKHYGGHCGHCAEVEYLTEIYNQ